MGFFEILIIFFFIVLPILEGIQKKRREDERKRQGGVQPDRPGPRVADRSSSRSDTPASAADMVPEDLWELLTGQKKPGTQQRAPEPEPAWTPAPIPAPEPVSAEYGELESADLPEAVSLEVAVPPPVERRVPTAEERHRQFEAEYVDHHAARPKHHTSALLRALDHPTGLQQAVLLKEILGPPKGLE